MFLNYDVFLCFIAVCAVGKETGSDNKLEILYGDKLHRRFYISVISMTLECRPMCFFPIGYIKLKLGGV